MTDSEGKAALKTAWGELGSIEKESKRYRDIIHATELDLEACRQKGVALEDELPERISSEEERELLGLLCRVHELEADKVSLQAERLARQGELRRRDLQLLRAERQRRLCEDIISTQRKIIEGGWDQRRILFTMGNSERLLINYCRREIRTAGRAKGVVRAVSAGDPCQHLQWSQSRV